MENVICTVVQEKTAEEFISFLNKYGVCTDYSNDYERSKAIEGIFVGVVNKVYDVVWKGEGGHTEHDTLFMSAKSLMSSGRESQPFRVGFVGNIVSQLIEVNLKEGDAIGILKPKFFYALDIPTLCAGVGNVVVWVAKNLNGSEVLEDIAKSSDENQYFQSLKKQRIGTANNRKRIPFIDEDSDTHSVGESSVSGSLGHDIQIFRSRPVELKRSQVSTNKKLVPDSTTRPVVQRSQNNFFSANNRAPENVLAENIVSQNTPNVGSATELSCRSENHCNLDSAVKFVHNDLCCSCHNVTNNTCGLHSCAVSCKTKCCSSRTNCPCHTGTTNQCKENSSSCNFRPPCACFSNQQCSCTRNGCCAHNAPPQCMHWNSAHSCRTDNSSCKRHLNHHCRLIHSCCMPCHARINQCCFSHCQNGCMKSKHFHRQTNLDERGTSYCNEQITAPGHCHNLCSCNHQKNNTSENARASNCYASRKESDLRHREQDNSNEEMSTEISEETHKKSRTKEWVHNWVGDPPHLLPDAEPSERLGTCSTNPSLESRPSVVRDGTTCNEPKEIHLNPSEPADCVLKEITQKSFTKKKKLYDPLDTSIISAKTVYHNSTIVEESTPFDSENHTDTPQDKGLSSDKNQELKDKNVNKDINLPLSNNTNLNNTLNATYRDPSQAKEANCNECASEGLFPEKNTEDSPLQNKEILSAENRNSSDEHFPSLQIETPIISQTCTESRSDGNREEMSNKTNQCESKMIEHVKVSCFNDGVNSHQKHRESTSVEKISDINNEENLLNKASDLHEIEHDGKYDSGTNENHGSNESDDVQIITVINKCNKDSSPNKSLALQDHSKSRELSSTKEMDSRMEFTLVSDNTIDKEGMKRSKESSDDAMELTCESMLMKRRKKDKFRKTRSVGSLSSGRNINEVSLSSADSFYDARSDGILSLRPNKWCLKPIKEVFDKPNFPFNQKVIEGLPSKSGTSYNLNLFSTFSVIGAIINVLPSLSEENFGNLVEGFCNEGCRTKYTYEDYKEMQPVCTECTFCRYNYHLACPGCSRSGSEKPLCLYYNFEIHLFDGENVLRVEVDHKSGVDFLGCTPQYYLHSSTIYKKINKIIFPITDDNKKDPVLLKAKIKVKPKSGASVLTLENTTVRKDLMFKGKHYKL